MFCSTSSTPIGLRCDQGRQEVADLLDDRGLHAVAGLVEQQEVGAVDQGAGDREHLLLPAGQRAAALAQPLAQEREPAVDLVEREAARLRR